MGMTEEFIYGMLIKTNSVGLVLITVVGYFRSSDFFLSFDARYDYITDQKLLFRYERGF